MTGLPISTYFSAVKLRWLMDNVEEVREAVQSHRAMFGTVDAWLIWVGQTHTQHTHTHRQHTKHTHTDSTDNTQKTACK